MATQKGGPKPTLSRSLGRFEATASDVATVIGSGIFVALGATAAVAGTGLIPAIVLAGLVALFTGLSGDQLAINYPIEGGTFTWARKFGHPTLGFVAGVCFFFFQVVALSVRALAFATYSEQLIPSLPIHVVSGVVVLLITALNTIGIKPTTWVLIILTIIKLGLLATFVGLAAQAADPANLQPILGNGPVGIIAGASIFFYGFSGFMRAAVTAAEIKDPRRNIPFATLVGLAIAVVTFLAVATVTLGILGAKEMGGSDVPVLKAAEKAIGPSGGWVILVAAWAATLSVLIGGLLAVSRVVLAMGEEKEAPAWLGSIHPRFRTPHHAIVAMGLGIAALAFLFDLRPLIVASNAFALIWFSITNIVALQVSKEKRFIPPIVSWLGLGGCLILFVNLPISALLLTVLVLVVLTGFRKVFHRAKGTQS